MPWLANLSLLSLWAGVHLAPGLWLGRGLVRTEGVIHLGIAAVLVGWMARHASIAGVRRRLSLPAQGPALAWLLAVGLPLGMAWFGPSLRSVQAAAMVLSAYGLAGLFLSAEDWKRARPLGLLLAAVLPLTGHLDVILGLPLRRWIASGVAGALGTLETATVMQVEGGYAVVDLPCAGVRSLWSAGVVLSGAALLWRKPVGFRWGSIAVATLASVLVANAVRVWAVVGLHHSLGLPLLAEVLHVPLGMVGFVLALGPGIWAIRQIPEGRKSLPRHGGVRGWPLGLMGLAACWLAPQPERVRLPSPTPVVPAGWSVVEPTTQERDFIEARGGVVRKASFEEGELSGYVSWISSRDWVNQHVPELCYRAGGWTLSEDAPHFVAETPVRVARLQRNREVATAVWWFERADHATDDHTERMADGLMGDRPWLLVSVIVSGDVDPQHARLVPLIRRIRVADRQTLAMVESP